MSLHEVSFVYPWGGFSFAVSSLFKIEEGRRELVHHEIPDHLFALGVSYPALDTLADKAADIAGLP